MIERVRDDISETADTVGNELSALGWLIRTAVLAAAAGAIYKELRKPPEERTWHGKLLGFLPYDFRPPTLDRIRDTYWNTRSDRLFTDKPIGIGWSINIAAVLKRLGALNAGRSRSRQPGTSS
jgi:hypothetical protein